MTQSCMILWRLCVCWSSRFPCDLSQQPPAWAPSRDSSEIKWNQSLQSALLSIFSPFHYKSCVVFFFLLLLFHSWKNNFEFSLNEKKKLITWWIFELFFFLLRKIYISFQSYSELNFLFFHCGCSEHPEHIGIEKPPRRWARQSSETNKWMIAHICQVTIRHCKHKIHRKTRALVHTRMCELSTHFTISFNYLFISSSMPRLIHMLAHVCIMYARRRYDTRARL